jgi:hypothetical protein
MFFGMIRQSRGSDDHPSANHFLYIYRLMSLSSIVKSPKRASVQCDPSSILVAMQSAQSPSESFTSSAISILQGHLLSALQKSGGEIVSNTASSSDQVFAVLNEHLSDEDAFDDIVLSAYCTNNDADSESSCDVSLTCTDESGYQADDDSDGLMLDCSDDTDHCSSQQCITYYLAGYVAYKMKKFTRCDKCLQSLLSNGDSDCQEAELIKLKSHGGLQIPSKRVHSLLLFLDRFVQKFVSKPTTYMYQDIVNEVMCCSELAATAVGCEEHVISLTARCIHFYVVTRVHFINRALNKQRVSRQEKQKLNKIAKLT